MEAIILAIFATIPFYFIWNALAPTYFAFLPVAYHQLPFWHCMGLLILLGLIRIIFFPATKIINKPKWFNNKAG